MNLIFDFCKKFIVTGKVLVAVVVLVWLTSPANAQECNTAYGNCLESDDFTTNTLTQGSHNPALKEMMREMQRQHELGLRQERAHREVDAVMHKNLLRLCAPYNEGCRKELNGQ